MPATNSKSHWDKVYATKEDQEVGWFQAEPKTSLQLIRRYASQISIPIVDAGGGNSLLSKKLWESGYSNISVVDIANDALLRSKNRLGYDGEKINWIQSSILDFKSKEKFQLWHDRAVFHFLTETDLQHKYINSLNQNLSTGGIFILGTFSENGPRKCSGLPIVQYSENKLEQLFGQEFTLLESFHEDHITPNGFVQNFTWAVFQKK